MNATPEPSNNPEKVIFLDRWVAAMRGIDGLSHELRLVCECLAENADMNGEDCAPGSKLLMQDTELSSSVVSASLKKLRVMKLIELVSDSHPPAKGPHLYRLTLPPDLDATADEMIMRGLHGESFTLSGQGKLSSIPSALLFSEDTETPRDDVVIPIPNTPSPRFSRHPKPSPAKRKGVRRRETVLYRYYDDQDVLLYVGVSANMPGRLEGHEADSTWMDFAARSTMDHFAERDDAEAAEVAAIEADHPLFNVLHNERPDRIRRLVDYLINRDRRDLLVPLISRG